jgi:hypothetical protein
MSELRPGAELAAEETTDAIGDEEEGRPSPFGKVSLHVSHEGGRQVTISELSARTLVGILDTVSGKGSQAKFQLAIAQQELEVGLEALGGPPTETPPVDEPPLINRAARRAVANGHAHHLPQ